MPALPLTSNSQWRTNAVGITTKRLTCAISLVALLYSVALNGQHNFRHFGAEEGLPSVFINNLAVDSLGFVWVNYASGLARYDGYHFKIYAYDPEDTLQYPYRGIIKSIFSDPCFYKGGLLDPHSR